jgi:hypothetical protein
MAIIMALIWLMPSIMHQTTQDCNNSSGDNNSPPHSLEIFVSKSITLNNNTIYRG